MPVAVYPAPGYDSFISLEDANVYLASLGYAQRINETVPMREAALRRGTQYVFSRRLVSDALWDFDVHPNVQRVHPNVAAATAEAAIRHINGSLYRDVDAAPVVQKTVGPLTLRYGTPSYGGQMKFPVIEDLLFGLVYTGAGYGPVTFERA